MKRNNIFNQIYDKINNGSTADQPPLEKGKLKDEKDAKKEQ